MNLTEYINGFPKCERMIVRFRIAKALGISEVYIRSMCNGQRKIPGKYAIEIERFTCGLVSRHVVAPHLYPFEVQGT